MKHVFTAVALATTLTMPAWAQNVAIVNGKPVPVARLNALAQQIERSGRPLDESMRAQLKDEVIAREVFAQEARKQGISARAEFRDQLELVGQTLLIRELFTDFQKKNPVTDAEVKAEYDKFVAANSGQEYRARHILVESEETAKNLIAALQKGAKFEDVAKKESKDTGSGANGGDLDWANPANFVPEFSEAMAKLKKGELTAAPVKSQFGWHIIRLDDTRQAELPGLDAIKPQLQQQVLQNKVMAYQEQLRAKAKVQ